MLWLVQQCRCSARQSRPELAARDLGDYALLRACALAGSTEASAPDRSESASAVAAGWPRLGRLGMQVIPQVASSTLRADGVDGWAGRYRTSAPRGRLFESALSFVRHLGTRRLEAEGGETIRLMTRDDGDQTRLISALVLAAPYTESLAASQGWLEGSAATSRDKTRSRRSGK